MATETQETSATPEERADNQAVFDALSTGKPLDPEIARRVLERGRHSFHEQRRVCILRRAALPRCRRVFRGRIRRRSDGGPIRWRKDKKKSEEPGESTIQSEPTGLTSEDTRILDLLTRVVHSARRRNMAPPFEVQLNHSIYTPSCDRVHVACDRGSNRSTPTSQ